MKKINKIKFLILSTLLLPGVTFAAFDLKDSNFKSVVLEVKGVVDILIPILTGLAFIVFFWGLSKFILNSGKPEEIKNGRNFMMWGILVLFILLTYRTIIGLVANELEIGNTNPNENNILLPQ